MSAGHIVNLSRRLVGFDPFLRANPTAASWKGALKLLPTRKCPDFPLLEKITGPTKRMKNPPIVIVAAVSRFNFGIGHNDGLLWHIPEDLKRFKKLTLGHPIIMGRRTFE